MVQGKPARKKPKDTGAVRAGGGGGPVTGSSRGGAGGGDMAPALLPNYMRATSCSGAKAPAAPQPQPQQGRRKVVLTGAVPRAGRATCSSAMKGPGIAGPAAAHACPYAYCSFKGHAHAHGPPLGSFVAERRRLIKTQQSMKLKGASPFRKPSTAAGVTSDVSCSSDLSAEDMDTVVGRMGYAVVVFDRLGSGGGDEEEGDPEGLGAAASVDGSCASSDVISVGSVELSGTSKHRGRKAVGEETFSVADHDFGGCKSDISEEELDAKRGGNNPEGGVGDAPNESSVDSISSSLSGISFEDVSSACAYAASSQKNRSSIARRRRASEQQMRPYKPKPPNFLLVETGPEAEKVDLKHQEVDDRRAAEEWMVDYALRKEVKKLARAQKRKVEMLVQAFESVLPTVANDKAKPEQLDNGDRRTFTLAWPSQPCT